MIKRKPKVFTLEMLLAKCIEVGNCWIWQGATDGKDRPQIRNGLHKSRSPRRVARELTDGKPIPEGAQVTSTCGDIACISPACSVISDPKTTAKMAVARGSYKRPDSDRRMALTKRAQSHITDETVQFIRNAENAKMAAAQTGVSHSYCKAIRRGDCRKDYTSPFAGLMV
jgi:hypothetical protein